jgi:hypothetical protein
VAQLAAANSELLNNIVFQGSNMGDDFKVLLQGYGCRVVDDPEAFDLIGPNIFLFSTFIEKQ